MANEIQGSAAKVEVSLVIKTKVMIEDNGYLGTGATVETHIMEAVNAVMNWQVLIKKGGSDPKPVKASFDVESVKIIPDGS